MKTLERTVLSDIAEEVARALSFATVEGGSAYVSTAVSYPNGSAVVVRIDADESGYVVTDDGQGAFIAETMGAGATFAGIARTEAARLGVSLSERSIFAANVSREALPGAVAVIANVSTRAVDRTAAALETMRRKRSQERFRSGLRSAFGERVAFDLDGVRGTWRSWDFDAGLYEGKRIAALFTFVSPAFSAVASASLKLRDVRSADDHPRLVVALADYGGTEASLRALLNEEADRVVPADSDPDQFRQVAA
ncbi:hypothetical protein [Salinarimonas rosea]|uniref:hypothetical protein n=1 Tax=Salinarimonas rosea TaxID=552063 RepID=UPI0003FB29E9|nr:hypothetical protein [Salinarimonas rosea]